MNRSRLSELLEPSDSWRSFLRTLEIVVLVVAVAVLLASLLYFAADLTGMLHG